MWPVDYLREADRPLLKAAESIVSAFMPPPDAKPFVIPQKPLESLSDDEKKLLDGIRRLGKPSPRMLREDTGLSPADFNAALDGLEEGKLVVRLHSYDHSYVLGILPV